MTIKWEQRKNEYFAYIRESRRVGGKTKTMNRYLGSKVSIRREIIKSSRISITNYHG